MNELATLGTYNDTTLVFTHDKKINLTDMWRAADGTASQRPANWLDLEGTRNFLESLKEKLNVEKTYILEKTRGVGGGTWGHYQVALAYAKYLSPEFHIWCNEVVKERIETQGVPKEALHRFKIPQTLSEALRLAADQAHQLELQAPKVEAYDHFMDTDSVWNLMEGFKSIGLHPKLMINWCCFSGYLRRDRFRVLQAYMTHLTSGIFVKKIRTAKNGNFDQTLITQKGLDYFTRMIKNNEIPAEILVG